MEHAVVTAEVWPCIVHVQGRLSALPCVLDYGMHAVIVIHARPYDHASRCACKQPSRVASFIMHALSTRLTNVTIALSRLCWHAQAGGIDWTYAANVS